MNDFHKVQDLFNLKIVNYFDFAIYIFSIYYANFFHTAQPQILLHKHSYLNFILCLRPEPIFPKRSPFSICTLSQNRFFVVFKRPGSIFSHSHTSICLLSLLFELTLQLILHSKARSKFSVSSIMIDVPFKSNI